MKRHQFLCEATPISLKRHQFPLERRYGRLLDGCAQDWPSGAKELPHRLNELRANYRCRKQSRFPLPSSKHERPDALGFEDNLDSRVSPQLRQLSFDEVCVRRFDRRDFGVCRIAITLAVPSSVPAFASSSIRMAEATKPWPDASATTLSAVTANLNPRPSAAPATYGSIRKRLSVTCKTK